MPGDFRCDLTYACAFYRYHCTRGNRAHRAPGIPCALWSRGQGILWQTSGASRRENAKVYSDVIARSDSDEAIHSYFARGHMDCFAEPVIGRAFARPVGSQWRAKHAVHLGCLRIWIAPFVVPANAGTPAWAQLRSSPPPALVI